MKLSQIRVWLVTCTLIFLAACGGGGGSNSAAPPSTATFQLRTAYISALTDTRSLGFRITGSTSGVSMTGTGTLTQGSVSSTTFERQAALVKTSTITATLSANGQSIPLGVTTVSYYDSNYNPLGLDGDEYEVVSSSNPIPVTARVNDTGIWYTSVRYSDSSKTRVLGTATVSYVLEPDTASTALLKIIVIEKDLSNSLSSTSTTTFRLTSSGTLSRISETVVEDSTSLTVTY